MTRALFRHLLLPTFETLVKRRKTFAYLRSLEESQWQSSASIAASQLQSLQALLAHAARECRYYREQWKNAGLDPRDVRSLTDFEAWPLLDRETVRTQRQAMRAAQYGDSLIQKSTGGSSGVPLTFDLDPASHERRTAAAHRGYSWAGAPPGSKQLYLWGVPLGERSWRARSKDALYHALYRRQVISCFEGDEELTQRFVTALETSRPDAIVAYVSPLYEVARRLEARGQRPAWAPRSIIVGAEKLHAFQRELIERVFETRVFETYGSREFMLVGAECNKHRGLHLTAEHLLVEILNDDGLPTPVGDEGNVVITDLFNYGMPFIRYVTGDRAVATNARCQCGRGLPLLERVVGRQLDMLTTVDGRTIPGEFFPHMVKDFAAVKRFQVIQESPALIRFKLMAEGMSLAERAALEERTRQAVGDATKVEFEPVDSIPLTAAGKLQVVVNRLALRKAS